jgi:hypothetical protein
MRPTSACAGERWISRSVGGSGGTSLYQNVMNPRAPMSSTRSNRERTSRIAAPPFGSWLAHSGWAVGNTVFEYSGTPNTVQPKRSATDTSAGTAPDRATSSPATMANRSGSATPMRRAASARFAGTVRGSIAEAGGGASAPSSSSTSMGIETNTGPLGGWAASWKARRISGPRSPTWCTSAAHFVSPRASPTRSPERNGSARRCPRCCCPAVTTIGVPVAATLTRTPIALPRPGAVWRLTNEGRPVAWA